MRINWQRRLQGYAPMTAKQLAVLNCLAEAKAQDWPFIPLEGVHQATINALFDADLIYISPDCDGVRFKITERGERTRKAYLRPHRRNDKLCPTCGERERHVTRSGRLDAYCLECGNKSKRWAYRFKRPQKNPDTSCSRCHKRARHVYASGRVCTYCLKCKNIRNRRRKRQDRKRDVKLAAVGQVKLCARPGCTRPRHVAPSGVLDWCREHYREWHNAYRQKKAANRIPGKIGRPRKAVEVQP